MRPCHDGQSLINCLSDGPERTLAALCPILRYGETTSAGFNFDSPTRAFAYNHTAVHKQCTLAAELGLVAQAAQESAKISDAEISDVNGVCSSMVSWCRERSDAGLWKKI